MPRHSEERIAELVAAMEIYGASTQPLPGLLGSDRLRSYAMQVIDSERRIEYAKTLLKHNISPNCADPQSEAFNPLKAAILRKQEGDIDEACWLVFLAVCTGKHLKSGWRLARDLYRANGIGPIFNWSRVSNDPSRLRRWLAEHLDEMKSDGVQRKFGNHRKYITLDASSDRGLASAVETYVEWIGRNRGHAAHFGEALEVSSGNRFEAFDVLYRSMSRVASFARTGKFDFLTMIGNLEFFPIEPGKPYLIGATGPLAGARLMFEGCKISSIPPTEAEPKAIDFANYLGIGMQVLEDSLCNWQKSPQLYKPFRG